MSKFKSFVNISKAQCFRSQKIFALNTKRYKELQRKHPWCSRYCGKLCQKEAINDCINSSDAFCEQNCTRECFYTGNREETLGYLHANK